MVLHKGVASRDLAPFPSHDLIYNRLLEQYFSARNAQNYIAARTDTQFPGAFHVEPNGFGVGSRRNDEVVFQLSLIPVKDHVHSGINAGILHASIGGYVGVPLSGIAADKVVRFLEQLVRPADLRGRICSFKAHANGSHRAGAGSVAKSPRSREAMPGRQIM